jgi:hypothetical protein
MSGKAKRVSFSSLFGMRGVGLLLAAVIAACTAGMAAGATAQTAKKAPGDSVPINSDVSILVGSEEPGPVEEAAEDLQSDFEKVFGSKPRIVHRMADAGGTAILIGEKAKLPEALRPVGLTERESFSISVASGGKSEPPKIVLLAGADMRGTIYAIYEFSQKYLGVDPLYYWTDHQPPRRTRIELPVGLDKAFPSPVFKYRGFFINDEDLLTGWAPGEIKDHAGISLAVWNKIFETILRLKGNMVAPGTWIFPDDPQVKLAGERGLIITQHHAIPLGVNVARWPKDVPYSYTEHPEILERAWKHAAAAYAPGQEVLWTVGLRGLSDASYGAFDPNVRGNDKALGEVISKAMAKQMEIVRSLRPNAQFITNLWQEGARLVHEGYLKIPPEVGTVWADTGYGFLQDKGEVTKGQGAYYHVAMYNGRANQLTEMVPVDRIDSELGRYIKAGATNYFLVNTSDVRPVSMTTEAVMNIAWKGLPSNAPDEDMRFYRQWSSEEFGPKAAGKVADIYKEYFAAPAQVPNHEPAIPYGDNYYHTMARIFLLRYMVGFPLYFLPGQSPKWELPRVFSGSFGNYKMPSLSEAARGEIERCGEAQPRWDALWQKALAAEQLVPSDRRPFYGAHVLAMIAIDRESNRVLRLVAQAVEDAQNGQTAQAHQAAEQSLAAFDEISKAESNAEYGKWKNWYRGDWLTGIYRTHELVETFLKQLDDPLGHMPPPILWDNWEGYYHIMHYEGSRTADVN